MLHRNKNYTKIQSDFDKISEIYLRGSKSNDVAMGEEVIPSEAPNEMRGTNPK